MTFSDALTSVRRWLWAEAILPQAAGASAVQELPALLREVLLAALAQAA